MYHVVSCSKYHTRTVRLVTGDRDKMLAGQMGECALCGPCSHVEMGKRADYWTVHSSHLTSEDATRAAWALAESADTFSTSYLPARLEPALSPTL